MYHDIFRMNDKRDPVTSLKYQPLRNKK